MGLGLDLTKDELKAHAASVRYDKEIGGTTVYGVGYPTDRETQAKLTAAALFAQVDNRQTFQWKLADGSFSETLSAAQDDRCCRNGRWIRQFVFRRGGGSSG